MASLKKKTEETRPFNGSVTMITMDLRRLRNAVNDALDHDVAYNLVHIAPLLEYVAEKIKA